MSTRSVALGAIIATAFFPLVVVLLNVVQAGRHNPLTQPASQLALGQDGWLMDLAFVALAVGTLLLALVLGRTVGSYRAVPVVLLAVAGVLGFVPAFVPTDPADVPPTTHGLIHNLNGLLTFVLYVAAMIAAGLAFRGHGYWYSLSQVSLIWGGAGVAAFVLMVVLGANNLFGLGERVAIVVWVSWMLLVAWHAFASRTEVAPEAVVPADSRSA